MRNVQRPAARTAMVSWLTILLGVVLLQTPVGTHPAQDLKLPASGAVPGGGDSTPEPSGTSRSAPAPVPVSTVKAIASLKQIMEAMVVPTSDHLFNVGRQAPENDDDWTALRNSAVILAESGNLLLVGDRVKDDTWVSSAHALIEAGSVALKATEDRNVDAVLEAGNLLLDSCQSCHEKHARPE
ncbi:MAG: hypothetical protein QF786_09495 [Vicinamibacterales bacterium]|nr:hypothetical protein [Vicinamibacterales bacterium]